MDKTEAKKFAIVGTSLTRRAELFKQVKGLFSNDPWAFFVPDVGEPYLATRPAQRSLLGPRVGRELQDLMLRNEQIAHDAGATTIVTDGSVLDSAMRRGDHRNELFTMELINRVADWLQTYTHMLVVQPTPRPNAENGDILIPVAMRPYMHRALLDILSGLKIPHTILQGDADERFMTARRIIGK